MALLQDIGRLLIPAERGAVDAAKHGIGHEGAHMMSKPLAESATAMVPGLGGSLGVIFGAGFGAVLVAGLTQGEYNSERKSIRRTYADEIAARLEKTPGKVNNRDVEHVAQGDSAQSVSGIRVISQAINKARKERNLGVATAVIASLATFGLFAAVGVAPVGLGAIAAQAVASFLTYMAIKTPLQMTARKIFHIDKHTAHDRIVEMEKAHQAGKHITRERVFEVFTAVDPELDNMIRKRYGRHFEKLNAANQAAIMDSVGRLIGLNEMTDAINSGRMDATELAFTAEGQVSGHVPGIEPPKEGILTALKNKMLGKQKDEVVVQHQVDEPAVAEKSFAERFARRPGQKNLSHTERLDQSRALENPLHAR